MPEPCPHKRVSTMLQSGSIVVNTCTDCGERLPDPLPKPKAKSIGAQLCDVLGLERCISFKIECSEPHVAFVTAVQYVGHDLSGPIDKVLRQYRLELLQETPLPECDAKSTD